MHNPTRIRFAPGRIAAILLGGILLAPALLAQSTQGTLSGAVLDPTGAAVPGAEMTLIEDATGSERAAISDATGLYVFGNLNAGNYSLVVVKDGFRPFEQTSLSIRVNQAARNDVQLELGATTETVTVAADASPLNYESGTRQEGVAPEVINELPLIVAGAVRNSANFAVLAPGVNTGGAEPTAFRSRINGGMQSGDEAIMDGVSMQQGTMSQTGMISYWDFPMTPDMVSEFKVLTSNYEPQYGSSTSAQIIVTTKSGTNEYHAGTYWYHRNTVLNARQFGADRRPKDIEHDYGVYFGGPMDLPLINKDPLKSYVYFNYERFSIAGGVTRPTISIPSLRQREGDFSDWIDADGSIIPVFDPASTREAPDGTLVRDQFNCNGTPNMICPSRFQNSLANEWLQHLPTPTNNDPLNNYLVPTPVPDALIANTNYYLGRVDNYIQNWGHLYFSVWHQSAAQNTNSLLPRILATERLTDPQNSWVVRSNFDVTWSPTFLTHVAYGYLNRNEGNTDVNLAVSEQLPRVPGVAENIAAPSIRFDRGFQGYGGGRGPAEGNKTTRPTHIFNNLNTWARGKHTIKFGGEYRKIGQVFNSRGNAGGTFNFGSGATGLLGINSGNPIASFLLEQVGSANAEFRTVNRWIAQADAYILHVGDTWRVTPDLTLNYGLRWDLFTPSREKLDRLSFFDSEGINAAAGGRRGRLAFAGNEYGEASFGARHPESIWKKGYAPRIGLAYAIGDKTVVRSGYGIFFTQAYYPEWGGGMSLDGFNASPSFSSTRGGLVPAFTFSDGFPQDFEMPPFIDTGFRNGQGILYRPFEANRRSYSMQWNLSIERQVGRDSQLSLAYVSNQGRRLPSAIASLNALNPSLLSMGDALYAEFEPGQQSLHGVPLPYDGWVGQMTGCAPSVAQALLPYPQYCSPLRGLNENGGLSNYHSFQAKYDKRFAGGTFMLASYTWSKLLTTSNHVNDVSATWTGLAGQISPFQRERNRSLASDDVPHVLSVAFVNELPFGKGKRYAAGASGALNQLIGGWQVSGIVRASSGIPLFFRSSGGGFCNIPGQFRMGCLPAVTGGSPFTRDLDSFRDSFDAETSRLYDPAAFESNFDFFAGTGPKVDNFRGYGYSNVDLTIVKNIKLGEDLRVQLRGEFFNILNQHHFVGTGVWHGGAFAFNANLASPDFGKWTGRVTTPRNVQVGVRVEF